VVDPRLMTLDEVFERRAISRPRAGHKVLVLVVGGVISQRGVDSHLYLQANALATSSDTLGHRREVGALNLPLPALFDEDQGTSVIDCQDLAVFGESPERAVRVDDPHGIAIDAKRWLSEPEA